MSNLNLITNLMKAVLSLLITLMFALGHYLAQAQTTVANDSVGNGFWEQGVSGQWADDLHAGPGFTGPAGAETHAMIAQNPVLADSYAEVLLPQPLNYLEIRKQIKYAYAQKCEGVFGRHTFEAYVNAQGKVEKGMGANETLLPYLMQLTFQPAKMGDRPMASWVEISFDFGTKQ